MRKILFICLALILTLGTLGVGYALWSDDLYIDGTIETGDVAVEWSYGIIYDTEPPEKDVSWATSLISGDTFLVDIFNAYPSITYYIEFDIHSTGSVPVHLDDFLINRGTLPAGATLDIFLYDWPNFPSLPVQLHEQNVAYGVIVVHLANDALENDEYSFSAQITAGQWNEFPLP